MTHLFRDTVASWKIQLISLYLYAVAQNREKWIILNLLKRSSYDTVSRDIFEMWSAVRWTVYSKWSVIRLQCRKMSWVWLQAEFAPELKEWLRHNADGNINMNCAFSLLSSFTKGIMTLPILLRGFSLRNVMDVCLKQVMRGFVGSTYCVWLNHVFVLGRKLLTKVTQGNLKWYFTWR